MYDRHFTGAIYFHRFPHGELMLESSVDVVIKKCPIFFSADMQ